MSLHSLGYSLTNRYVLKLSLGNEFTKLPLKLFFPYKIVLLLKNKHKKKKERQIQLPALSLPPLPIGEQYPYSKSHWISPSWNTLTTLRLNMLFFFFYIYNIIVWKYFQFKKKTSDKFSIHTNHF